MIQPAYALSFAVSFIFVIIAAAMLILRRKSLSDMSGMMAGMGFGMLTGLITATMYLIPTGDFLWGTIYGSIIGSIVGVALGWLGGPMGVLEGIMAGPMGGMMGAMLGQMIRPFDLTIFMIYFFILQAITVSCILYCLAHKRKKESCCWEDHIPAVPTEQIISLIAVFIVAAALVIMVSDFSITKGQTAAQVTAIPSSITLPPGLAQATKSTQSETLMEGKVQKITIVISSAGYTPDIIIAKKGIPLRIDLEASSDASCGRDVIFPTLNKRILVAQGGKESFTIDKMDAGEIPFHCSMDMLHGKIIIQ